jgi:hypothetical protein
MQELIQESVRGIGYVTLRVALGTYVVVSISM